MIKLKDIELGRNDGGNEAIHVRNFEDLFYDYNNIYESAIDKEKFLILGKKGTGKTLLAELIKKNFNKDGLQASKLESYKTYDLTMLQSLKNGEVIVDEYVPIWTWIILIELCKLVVQNKEDNVCKESLKIVKFLNELGFTSKLGSFKTVGRTKEINDNNGWDRIFSIIADGKSSLKPESYLELIEPLKDLLIEALSETEGEYILMFDELDDKFQNNETYKSSIVGLLKVANKLNKDFLGERVNFKILLFLRKDIFSLLNYPDLNKIVRDSSLTLDWGENRENNSPLLNLVTNKVKKSILDFGALEHKEIMKKLFAKENIKFGRGSVPVYTYIIDRTLMRPRDLITYITLIKEKHPLAKTITKKMVLESEKDYSSYFKDELKDELIGHLYDDEIFTVFSLIKAYGKPIFSLRNLEDYYNKHKQDYSEVDLKSCLKHFYKVGAIGTRKKTPHLGRTWTYSWGFREVDYNASLDDTDCVVHNGLKKELNL